MEPNGNGHTFSFRPAIWEPVGLLVGYAGPSGSGKTYSAMRTARGIVGKNVAFAVIDTENKRSRHYVKYFAPFDVVDLTPPYRPDTYYAAIKAAMNAGYKAIIIDSMSHEHAGEGGVLEWQNQVLDMLVKRAKERESSTPEWKLEERLGPKSWIEPKTSRKKTIQQMLFASTTVPIIVCFRAEEKLFIHKDKSGKTEMATKWAPVCGKEYPYEMTAFLMLDFEKPGYPQALKLQEQHKSIFPHDKQIDEETGRRIAEWAKGDSAKKADKAATEIESGDNPTPEEEEQARREAGITGSDDKPGNGGTFDVATFKSAIGMIGDGQSLMKWYASEKKKLTQEDLVVASKLVNDRLLTLKKEGHAQ